jgi:thiol-disulfide isomerase/thioredoxin
MRRAGIRRAVAALVAPALLPVLLLTGCTESPAIGKQVTLPGDVQISEYKDRKAVEFSGRTIDGSTFRSSDARGNALVVNFWYAGCGPCRAEAPDLVALEKKWAAKGVHFVGVNVRDEAGQAAPFQATYKVPYPSVLDASSGAVQLAFARSGALKPNAIPTTVVLDKQGRIASSVLGELPGRSVLDSLIDTAESS